MAAREQLDKSYAASSEQGRVYNDSLRLISPCYKHSISNTLDLLDAERSSYGAETVLLADQPIRLENPADLYEAFGDGPKREVRAAEQVLSAETKRPSKTFRLQTVLLLNSDLKPLISRLKNRHRLHVRYG